VIPTSPGDYATSLLSTLGHFAPHRHRELRGTPRSMVLGAPFDGCVSAESALIQSFVFIDH
jgi:hypothetical protein